MVGISEYIIGLGRPVAFYPKLKKVTGSTTATILLCQFLYWSDKTKDGWIWKTSSQIEEETGLTENEQRTARRKLEQLGILKSQYMRLEHMIRFRVDTEKLNNLWEQAYTLEEKTTKENSKEDDFIQPSFLQNNLNEESNQEDSKPEKQNLDLVFKKVEKRAVSDKETLDALEAVIMSPATKKAQRLREMQDLVESKIHINTKGRKWQNFYEYAYRQEKEKGYNIEQFLEWLMKKDNFDPMYWGPDKMMTMYPQAFIAKDRRENRSDDRFVSPPPKVEEENYAPMPKEAKANRDLI